MGQLKDEAIKKTNEDVQRHELSDSEINYVRLLNLSLQYHTFKQQILTGFLYYIATTRLGYKDGSSLMFEIVPDDEDNGLYVKLLPADMTQEQAQQQAQEMANRPAPPAPNETETKDKPA